MKSLFLVCLALAAPVSAAPLCRDGKGLFTPCPPATVRAYQAKRAVASKPVPEDTASAHADADARPAKPGKPALVATARLCRDTKGLFTPCPR